MAFTHAPSIDNHRVANIPHRIITLLNGPRKIDTGNQWVLSNNRRGSGNRQRIFVVDGAVIDFDQDTGVCEV